MILATIDTAELAAVTGGGVMDSARRGAKNGADALGLLGAGVGYLAGGYIGQGVGAVVGGVVGAGVGLYEKGRQLLAPSPSPSPSNP